jgi:serine/threonine-protein kinase HipA
MAEDSGISTVPHVLVRMGKELAYITRRVDRTQKPKRDVGQLAMEDFCQLDLRLVFSFIIGNSDMRLKNFSLLERREELGQYVLSPAYDLLPVHVVMPEDTEEFALTMNGKKRGLRRKDFLVFVQACGIDKKPAGKMLDDIISRKSNYIEMTAQSLLPAGMKQSLIALIEKRADVIA